MKTGRAGPACGIAPVRPRRYLLGVDDEYTSGPWTGFYTYAGGHRERMNLSLSFREGKLSGSGSDPVGPFLILGGYDPTKGEVWWAKTYVGAHEVHYKGYRDARGIWGTWEIHPGWTGGFHIWPRGQGDGAAEEAEADLEAPVAAAGTVPAPRPTDGPPPDAPFHLDSASSAGRIASVEGIAARYDVWSWSR